MTTPMIERIAKVMTYSGACTAAGCGYAGGGTLAPAAVMTLSDWGLIIGIMVGLFGGFIQFMSWMDRKDTKRREDDMRALEIQLLRARERREEELHRVKLACGNISSGS